MIKFSDIVKNMLYMILISAILSFVMMFVCWLTYVRGRNLPEYLDIFNITFLSMIGLMLIAYGIYLLCQISRKGKEEYILSNFGYTDEFYDYVKSNISKKDNATNISRKLKLIELLVDGERYDEVKETILSIDMSSLNGYMLISYYQVVLYYYVQLGDIENAQRVYDSAEDLFPNAYKKKNLVAKIEVTLGMFEYLKGNYELSEEHYLHAETICKDKIIKVDNALCLSLLYLKTDRKDLAKQKIIEIVHTLKTPRQISDAKLLMKMIERAYNIC